MNRREDTGSISMEDDRKDQGNGQGVVEKDFLSENAWRALILASSAAVLLFSIYCLSHGITTIFMHLYYFPIILFAYRYQKRGVIFSIILALSYVLMVAFFSYTNVPEIIGAIERFITIIGVALVIAYLSIQMERKQSEIQRLSQFQKNIISNAQVWLTVLDSKGTILIWNKAAQDISGYSSAEVIGENTIWKQLYPDPDYRKTITGIITRIINENKYFEHFESTILTKHGERKVISWNTSATPDETGGLSNFVAIGIDITERKLAEDALKESEARYSALFYHNNSVSLLIDPDTGIIVDANSSACTYYGYTQKQMTGLRIFDLNRLPQEKVLRHLSVAKNAGEKHFFSNHFLAKGERRNVEIFSGPITVKGKPLFYSIIHDVTDRKKAETALRESEHELAEIIEHLPDATLVIDRTGKVIAWNKAIEEMTGVKAEDMVGKGDYEYALPFYGTRRPILLDLVFESDEKLEWKYYNVIQKRGDLIIAETDLPILLGKNATLWVKASPLYDEKGNKIGAIETIRDVTERKKAEDRLRSFNEELERGIAERTAKINAALQALKESETKFHEIFNNVNDAIHLHEIGEDGRPGKFIDVNDVTCQMLQYSREEMLQHSPLDFATEYHSRPVDKIFEELRTVGHAVFETGHKRKDGTIVPVEINAHKITFVGREVVLSVVRDNTERKIMIEQIEASLAEKETLLKEIHHRVKNNLQIIASLLNLQGHYVKDEQTLAVIKDSQNRIKAMALIHEKIYQSKSLDRIDYGDYLEKITRSIFESYGVSPEKITMKIHAKNIFLHIDKAIPCSLIINELLTNSFKHAFPDDRAGEIRIDIKLDGGALRLLYSDNGIGLPESVTLDRTESLGMRLISGLIQQLKGTVEIQRGGEGTTFDITFII